MTTLEQLEQQVGSFALAVIIHSQNLAANDPFWNSLNFWQWRQVFHQAPPQSQIALTATQKMEKLAEGFSQKRELYFNYCRLNDTAAAAAARTKAVEVATTFHDWDWVLFTAGANMDERRHAIGKMKEIGGSFENWQASSLTTGKVGLEQMLVIAEVDGTDKRWLTIYGQAATYGYADVAKTAVTKLDTIYNFEQWQALSNKHWREHAGGANNRLAGHAIKRMEELAATPQQCLIVHEADSDEVQKAHVVEKMKAMDTPFAAWEKIHSGCISPAIKSLAMAKMVEKAMGLEEWKLVYSHGNSDEQELAISAMTRLTGNVGAH